jgi:hypothetical protein
LGIHSPSRGLLDGLADADRHRIAILVGGGLAAHRLEPGAIEERRHQRVAGQRLIEPRNGGCGADERRGQRGIHNRGRWPQKIKHGVLPTRLAAQPRAPQTG